ncbi:MAG: type IV secretion system protein, partial [Bacilli bacterium]
IAEDTKDKMKNKETRDISITTILKVDNKNYQVRWIETGYDERGNIVEKIKKSGIYTIEIIQSNSEEKLLINPVGITITDYSFNNEM